MNVNDLLDSLMTLYARLLHLYPRRFREEFAEEMQVVFQDSVKEAVGNGMLSMIFICLRELGGLPLSILREFWHEIERKETIMVTEEKTNSESIVGKETTMWDTVIGVSPFALFGFACMLAKTKLPFHGGYPELAFFIIVLIGLVIGLAKDFPRWAYSYLGWSMVMSWSWTMMPIDTFSGYYSPITHNQLLGWRSWIPLLIAVGIGLLLARSLHPLRKLVRGIWQDWTLLSLAIYAFVAFVSLIYDENHHPYLFAFIAATTIVVCLAVWGFLKSDSSWKRVVSLLAGFVTALVLNNISYLNNMSYATRDYAAYLGLPPSPPQPWYTAFDGVIVWTLLYSGIMYWPVVIGVARRAVNNRKVA
jgi:hypothetical protein